MDELTSMDYAQLIKFAAFKYHRKLLNRTQIHKILFYVYGVYLAQTNQFLFNDDKPRAWPYGPVFPIVNQEIDKVDVPMGFVSEKARLFRENQTALQLVKSAVDKLHNKTAYKLTQWSHKKESPWYKTIFPTSKENVKWNTEIEETLIKEYFSNINNINV